MQPSGARRGPVASMSAAANSTRRSPCVIVRSAPGSAGEAASEGAAATSRLLASLSNPSVISGIVALSSAPSSGA